MRNGMPVSKGSSQLIAEIGKQSRPNLRACIHGVITTFQRMRGGLRSMLISSSVMPMREKHCSTWVRYPLC